MSIAINPATARFEARREQILCAGARLMNERGLKGLSLGGVADAIGIGASSVTYYFRRKELLAEACYDRALDALEERVRAAAEGEDPGERIARLVRLTVAAADDESGAMLARLHELRAMDDPGRSRLLQRYFDIFRLARLYYSSASGGEARLLQVMRVQVLFEALHSLPDWLARYAPQEHERVGERLTELLLGGLAPAGAQLACDPLTIEAEEGVQDRFLGAATMLMNERGYRGASVERIVAALKVTKGSFYHHLGAKDDLVLACYRRSLGIISRAQDAALGGSGSELDRLATALSSLIAVQLGEGTPLLRSTALAALPTELMREAVDRSEQLARRFAGMIIDGIAAGVVKPVDPLIGGQLILSSLNTAFELRDVSGRVPPEAAFRLYASTVLHGLVDQRPPLPNQRLG